MLQDGSKGIFEMQASGTFDLGGETTKDVSFTLKLHQPVDPG